MIELTLDTISIYEPFNIRVFAETDNYFLGIADINYDEGFVETVRKHGKNIIKDKYYPEALKLELNTYSSICKEVVVNNQFAVEHSGKPLKEKVVPIFVVLKKAYGRDVDGFIDSVLEEADKVSINLNWGDTFILHHKSNDVWFETTSENVEIDNVELKRILRALHFPIDINNAVIIKKQAGRKKVV
jgi:hypothetical protein